MILGNAQVVVNLSTSGSITAMMSESDNNEDRTVYGFTETGGSASSGYLVPQEDFDGNDLELVDSEKFGKFGSDIADQVMYMDTRQTVRFVGSIEDPDLLRSIIVFQKNLQHHQEFDLLQERITNANSEAQKEAVKEEHTELGHESLLELPVEEAIEHLSPLDPE